MYAIALIVLTKEIVSHNKNMKKFVIILSLLFLLATPAVAIDLGFKIKVGDAAKKAGYGVTTETTLAETAGIAINAALSFVGVIFLVLMVYAGYLWFTSRGEEEPIKKAQKIIMASAIGLAIVAGAYGITEMVVPIILEKTTGEGGGAPPAGGGKVECCYIGGDWAVTYSKFKWDEKTCKDAGGDPQGLVPEEECK